MTAKYATLAELAQKATTGPWRKVWHRTNGSFDIRDDISNDALIVRDALPGDAAFIAAADPSTILALLDVVEAARLVSQWHNSIGSGPIEELDYELGELARLCAPFREKGEGAP